MENREWGAALYPGLGAHASCSLPVPRMNKVVGRSTTNVELLRESQRTYVCDVIISATSGDTVRLVCPPLEEDMKNSLQNNIRPHGGYDENLWRNYGRTSTLDLA